MQHSQGELTTFIDPFYSWTKVETYTRGDMYGKGTPPEMLFIGCDPGGIEVLLSLRPADYGHLFCWFHSTNIWGTDDNDRIWYQAASFEAFLGSLHDEPDGSDYESWRTPLFDKLAKPLVF